MSHAASCWVSWGVSRWVLLVTSTYLLYALVKQGVTSSDFYDVWRALTLVKKLRHSGESIRIMNVSISHVIQFHGYAYKSLTIHNLGCTYTYIHILVYVSIRNSVMHILCKLYLPFGDTESPRHRGHLGGIQDYGHGETPQAKAGWLDFHGKLRVKKNRRMTGGTRYTPF